MTKKKLTLSNKHFSGLINALFDQLHINFFAIDKDGYYIARNHTLTKVVGETHRADKVEEKAWKSCLRVMSTGESEVVEEAYKNRWYLSFKSPLIEEGQTVGVIGISLDITDRKQAELAKSEFLLNMQHDLRTPFSGLLSISSLLYEQETDDTKKQFQGLVVQSASRLLQLLDQILELSQLGDHPISYSQFNIQEAVNEIIELLNAEIQMKGLRLSVECPESDIYTDKMRFNRILLNLLGNAVKFTNQGKIIIKVALADSLSLSIEDTGIGIPKDKINFIFDKFSKLKLSNTEQNFKGSGVGLYIVKQFVNDLGGTVEVKSEFGKGSVFMVSLPVKKVA